MELTYQIIAGLVSAASAGGALLLRRARAAASRPVSAAPCAGCDKEPPLPVVPPVPTLPRTWRERLGAMLNAIGYLRTRREWRYRKPWIMLVGEGAIGKSSALASIPSRPHDLEDPRARELALAGIAWRFFEQGFLLDPDGRLPSAGAGTPEARAWSDTLDRIDALRPERPLDGLLLAVSARTLRHGSAEQRRLLAENAYRQLDQIQQRFEFMLPVYVVVTEADAVDGFSSFWRAQPQARQTEMFGWSAPAGADNDTPEEWAEAAFDTIVARLKTLQVQAAASSDRIADVGGFFLFPRHLQQLRAPTKEWLAAVFRPTAWHAGFMCRGIYFSGSIAAQGERSGVPRHDVGFVSDLVTRKVLAEPHLARPTRQGIWSRNRLIRAMQIASIALFIALLVALAIGGNRLERQIEAQASALRLLQDIEAAPTGGEACTSRERIYDLLNQVARIDANNAYWTMPASWFFFGASRQKARMIAAAALQRIVMPGLACQLEQRSYDLAAYSPPSNDAGGSNDDPYPQARKELFSYLQAVRDLELNLVRFSRLAGDSPPSEPARQVDGFAALAEYAYGGSLPATVKDERGALSAALADVRYSGQPRLPAGMRQNFADRIARLSARLRLQLDAEVQVGGPLLARLEAEREPVLANTKRFTSWLGWVRKSWQGSSPQDNPCEELRAELAAGIDPLVVQYHYPAALAESAGRFGSERCYKPSLEALAAMQFAPYGLLLMRQEGSLQLNPELTRELDGLTALMALAYMQLSPRAWLCQATASGWRTAEIEQAAAYAKEFQDFARARGLPAPGTSTGQPLYGRLARHQLERAMTSALRDAQQPPADESSVRPAGVSPVSLPDQELAQQSAAFAKVADPLAAVLRIYDQFGFGTAPEVAGCSRSFASEALRQASALATASRLYDPDPDPSGDAFFSLGTAPVIKDYLARQVARSQVLAGYATPFVNFLQSTRAIDDTRANNDQTASYWNNTIAELNRYVQFKEPNGQVAQLDKLFLKQLAELTADDCGDTLDYEPAEYGDDFFSERRRTLEDDARWRCEDDGAAQARTAYRTLLARFRSDLAGYPFADPATPAGTRDAPPGKVRAFLADYGTQRASLRKSLSALSGTQRNAMQGFLDQLDAASAFFSGTLDVDPSQPLKLAVTFHAQASASAGAEQIVNWSLSSGARSAGYPNRPTALDWQYGQPLSFDLVWANRSLWRPMSDPQQGDLRVSGSSASFSPPHGDWALLRLIEAHRPKSGALTDPYDPNRVLLEFTIPVTGGDAGPGKAMTDKARLYLGFNLAATDPKTQAPTVLKLPTFPRVVPKYEDLTWIRKSRR